MSCRIKINCVSIEYIFGQGQTWCPPLLRRTASWCPTPASRWRMAPHVEQHVIWKTISSQSSRWFERQFLARQFLRQNFGELKNLTHTEILCMVVFKTFQPSLILPYLLSIKNAPFTHWNLKYCVAGGVLAFQPSLILLHLLLIKTLPLFLVSRYPVNRWNQGDFKVLFECLTAIIK